MAAVSGAGLGELRQGVGGALMGSNGAAGKKKKAKNYNDDGGTMSLKKAYKSGKLKKKAKKKNKKKNKKKGKKKNSSHGGAKAHARVLPQENDPPEQEPTETQVPTGTTEPEQEPSGTPVPEVVSRNLAPSTGVPFPEPVRAPHPASADYEWDIQNLHNVRSRSEASGGMAELPEHLSRYLPTITAATSSERNPYIDIGSVEIGQEETWNLEREANPILNITPVKWKFEVFGTSVAFGWRGPSVEIGIQTPKRDYAINMSDQTASVSFRQSASVALEWDGWNTTSRAEYNPVDYSLQAGDIEGSGTWGLYVEEKPVRNIAHMAMAQVVAAGAFLLPGVAADILANLDKGMIPEFPY
jgi:hypothetical protein